MDGEEIGNLKKPCVIEHEIFKRFYLKLIKILPTSNILYKLVSARILSLDDSEEITSKTRSTEKASYILNRVAKSLEIGITFSFYTLLGVLEEEGGDVTLLVNEIKKALIEHSEKDVEIHTVETTKRLKAQAINELTGKYSSTVLKIRDLIEENHPNIGRLVLLLCNADKEKITEFSTDSFTAIKTIDHLFYHIGLCCSIYDYELLEAFVEATGCQEAKKILSSFTNELQNSILKELDLLEDGLEHPSNFLPGTSKFVIEYVGGKCTLGTKAMVKNIVCECFNLKKSSIIFRGAGTGSVLFIYQLSSAVRSHLLQHKISKGDVIKLSTRNIAGVMVDDIPLLHPIKKPSLTDELGDNKSKAKCEESVYVQGRVISKKIKLTKLECIISLDDAYPTMELPCKCGHAMAPQSFAQYVEDQLYRDKTEIRCPICTKVWDKATMMDMGLTDKEKNTLEAKLARNLSDNITLDKVKECPNCQLQIEYTGLGIKIKCPICKDFEFCLRCLRKWKKPECADDCGNYNCTTHMYTQSIAKSSNK